MTRPNKKPARELIRQSIRWTPEIRRRLKVKASQDGISMEMTLDKILDAALPVLEPLDPSEEMSAAS